MMIKASKLLFPTLIALTIYSFIVSIILYRVAISNEDARERRNLVGATDEYDYERTKHLKKLIKRAEKIKQRKRQEEKRDIREEEEEFRRRHEDNHYHHSHHRREGERNERDDKLKELVIKGRDHDKRHKKRHEFKEMLKRQHGGGGFEEEYNNNGKSLGQEQYEKLREEFDVKYPSANKESRLQKLAEDLRGNKYETFSEDMDYDIHDCPFQPPPIYPKAWNLVNNVIKSWNPDNPKPPSDFKIHQGLCIFDYHKDLDKALNYRNAEKPFILKNDPNILSIAERWNDPDYLPRLFGDTKIRTEYSTNNHFMFARARNYIPQGWEPPTEDVKITYSEWLFKAEASATLKLNEGHYYFRANGCQNLNDVKCQIKMPEGYAIAREVDIFQGRHPSFYIVEPDEFRGINCRFGMTSVIAENHFDGSRNMIVLLKGERRYILSHPNQCKNLALFPRNHPSGRHSQVDWSDADLEKFPEFAQAMGNEVVMQAGDLLYLPTYWFHYIISLEGVNFQCNARSGITYENEQVIHLCGF